MKLIQKFCDEPTPAAWEAQEGWELPSNQVPSPIRQTFQQPHVRTIEVTFTDGSAIRYERTK